MRRPSLFFAILAVGIVGTIEIAACINRSANTIAASDLRIIDGDTVALGQERIHLLEIAAPEIGHAHCAAELAAGISAVADLRAIIEGKRVTIRRDPHPDRYGRTLAVLIVDNKDIGAILMADGAALPYKPGFNAHRERTAHWCGPGDW